MIFKVYSALLYVISVFFFPYMGVKLMLSGRGRQGIRQRFGSFEDGFFKARGAKTVWVHAVSVGETLAAVPLVKALKEKRPDVAVYFSTVTETGNKVAADNLGGIAKVFYFPFDFPFSVRRTLKGLGPDIFVLVETEIWPNLLRELKRQAIPAVMVNGRISPRSYKGYSRARFFMRRVLELPCSFGMQTQRDAERITSLGAPAGRVSVTGNIKFDQACKSLGDKGPGLFTRAGLGLPEKAVVLVAGSTHEGEEVEVLKAYRLILQKYPDAFLVLAPRHPERLSRVEALLKGSGLDHHLKSQLTGERLQAPVVILLDTMGELAALYRVATVAFVGGSWAPVGGHNVLEPAAFGVPVFFGPHMHNFSEPGSMLRECGAGIEVADGEHLAAEAVRIIEEPGRMDALGRAAKEVLRRNRGALDRNVGLIERCLI